MKKLLLLGDIHANYPALQSILRHIDQDRFDLIINTGDFTVYGPFPNETIQWFRERNRTICILGNTDRRILRILKGKKLKKPKNEEKRVMYYWTAQNLHSKNATYLESLPKQKDFTLNHVRIGVFHGTFDDPDEELFPSSPKSRFSKLSKDSPYQIHIMGHSHVPYHKIVNGVHFINPGSVGRMFDGDPSASYAILTLSSENILVKHFRIPYPVEATVNSLKKNRLPDIYGTMLRTGKKLN